MLYTLLALLVITFILFKKKPSSILVVALIAEIIATSCFLLFWNRNRDVSSSFSVVFQATGYQLGSLLLDSGQEEGRVLVLQIGEGKVNEWQNEGLRAALAKSRLRIIDTLVIPFDPYSGRFLEQDFKTAIEKNTDISHVVAFAGLPKKILTEPRLLYVCHHTGSPDDLADWMARGLLLGVISPKSEYAAIPTGKESMQDIAKAYFSVIRKKIESSL